MPNGSAPQSLRDQLREAKMGYRKLAGEIERLSWQLAEAHERVMELEKQLSARAA